jgi:hypothetical protein
VAGDAVAGDAVTDSVVTADVAAASVLATAVADIPAPDETRSDEAVSDEVGVDEEVRLVADTRGPVIPPRPEPFIPQRRPDFPEGGARPVMVVAGGAGAAVAASGEPVPDASAADARLHIERDPSVNKSLLLRLIAGVRGL